jgi:hypothetical protein
MQLDPPVPAIKPSNVWSWGAKPPKQPAEYEQLLEMPPTGKELVKASRNAFEALLEGREKLERLYETDVTGICDFLRCSADEPAARNTTRLVEWLLDRSLSQSAWQNITALICDKIQLASIDHEELIRVIKVLPKAFDWQHNASGCQQLHDIYAAFATSLPQDSSVILPHQAILEEQCKITQSAQACSDLVDRLNMVAKLTSCVSTSSENLSSTLLAISRHGGEDEPRSELLSRLARVFDEIPTEIVTEVLGLSTRFIVDKRKSGGFVRAHALNWLKCLSAYQSLGRSPLDMKIVYGELAKTLRPSQLADHLATLHTEPYDTIRLLLDTWLPNTDLSKLQSDHRERRNASSGRREVKTLQFSLRDLSVTDLPVVADEFERLRAVGGKYAWTDFLRAFARAGFEYEAMAHEVFGLCKAKYPARPLYRKFLGWLNNPELVLPSSVAVSLIKHLLEAKEPYLALSLFKEVPSVAITDVPELPLAVLEHEASSRDMFELILRQPDTVPMESREIHKLDVTPKHIEVVHLLAYDIANATVLRPSQAYRSVWACYRWLQDRGAPLNPLISRAIVTAGILRPLQENIWIPEQRFDYILSIVEKVEGAKDRIQVEMLARRMRDAHHQGVLSKRRAKYQNSWIEASRTRATETRYRIKRWAKEKPLPMREGLSYYVPPMPCVNAFLSPLEERTEGASTSLEAKELEGWWRPDGEGALMEFEGQVE